jgi:folate-dependent phosphoribosylglycinamide formyltransferase PurN
MRLVLTAGFGRSYPTLALAELLRRRGDEVAAVIVVSALNPRRARTLLRQRGIGFITTSARRMLGRSAPRAEGRHVDPMAAFLKERRILPTTLKAWARQHDVVYRTVRDINDRHALDLIREVAPEAVLYGGGGILHEDFLTAAEGRVLNAHSGPLPEIRGMNACEWSVLLDLDPVVTIHRIDRGIDTGASVLARPVNPEPEDTIDDLRLRCAVEGVLGMLQATSDLPEDWVERPGFRPCSRQCFIMAPAVRELTELRLTANDRRLSND